MRILKVLNNNAALVAAGGSGEMVVFGKGISFGKHTGDTLPDDLDCKRFVLSDREARGRFSELIASIPDQVVYTSEKIINYGKLKLGVPLSEHIFITLTDHIASVLDRYAKGIRLRNPLAMDIKRFYSREYEVGERAVRIIGRDLTVELLPDEASFIALHFVNAQMDLQQNRAYEITEIIQDIVRCVEEHFHVELDEDSIDYFRFVTHVRAFAQRLLQGTIHRDETAELFEQVCELYPRAYACTRRISERMRERYGRVLSKDEEIYMTVHIARVTQNL